MSLRHWIATHQFPIYRHGYFEDVVSVDQLLEHLQTGTHWQYYYGVNKCPARSSADRNCICWHDEGTGPMPGARHGNHNEIELRWREKPSLGQIVSDHFNSLLNDDGSLAFDPCNPADIDALVAAITRTTGQ